MDYKNFKIKERIEHDDKTYLLLSLYENELLPEGSVSNIIAIDKKETLLWTIEPPTTKYDIYARMYFKDDVFIAVSSSGQIHQIDENTGKIISSKMIK